MKITRKTEISVRETKRLVISAGETEDVPNCPVCAGDEAMLIAEQAASVFGLSRRGIYRLVESEKLHFFETENGILFICPHSIKVVIETGEEREQKTNELKSILVASVTD